MPAVVARSKPLTTTAMSARASVFREFESCGLFCRARHRSVGLEHLAVEDVVGVVAKRPHVRRAQVTANPLLWRPARVGEDPHGFFGQSGRLTGD